MPATKQKKEHRKKGVRTWKSYVYKATEGMRWKKSAMNCMHSLVSDLCAMICKEANTIRTKENMKTVTVDVAKSASRMVLRDDFSINGAKTKKTKKGVIVPMFPRTRVTNHLKKAYGEVLVSPKASIHIAFQLQCAAVALANEANAIREIRGKHTHIRPKHVSDSLHKLQERGVLTALKCVMPQAGVHVHETATLKKAKRHSSAKRPSSQKAQPAPADDRRRSSDKRRSSDRRRSSQKAKTNPTRRRSSQKAKTNPTRRRSSQKNKKVRPASAKN